MKTRLVLVAAFLIGTAMPAAADPQQDFIIAKVNEQYQGLVRQVGNDKAKKAKLVSLRSQTIKKVQSKPGLGGRADAEAGMKKMQEVVQ